MKHRVLLTDVGNVIAPFSLERYTENLSKLTGMSSAEISARLYSEMSGGFTVSADGCRGIHRDILVGKMSSEQYREAVQERLGKTFQTEEFWRAFRDVFIVNGRLVRLFIDMREKGNIERIVCVTDADPVRLKHALEITGLEPDAVAASYEVGELKPHSAMYERALELAQAAPHECIFVDDILVNVMAARELGITSFQFLYADLGRNSANEALMHNLRRHGLL